MAAAFLSPAVSEFFAAFSDHTKARLDQIEDLLDQVKSEVQGSTAALREGDLVRIYGLQESSAAALNGTEGMVISGPDHGRYGVLVAGQLPKSIQRHHLWRLQVQRHEASADIRDAADPHAMEADIDTCAFCGNRCSDLCPEGLRKACKLTLLQTEEG